MFAIVFKDQLGVPGSALAAAQQKVTAINTQLGYDWTDLYPHPRNADDIGAGTTAMPQGVRYCVRTTIELNNALGISPGIYAHTLDEGTPGADVDGVPYDWSF
jgi:hypothetical protein